MLSSDRYCSPFAAKYSDRPYNIRPPLGSGKLCWRNIYFRHAHVKALRNNADIIVNVAPEVV